MWDNRTQRLQAIGKIEQLPEETQTPVAHLYDAIDRLNRANTVPLFIGLAGVIFALFILVFYILNSMNLSEIILGGLIWNILFGLLIWLVIVFGMKQFYFNHMRDQAIKQANFLLKIGPEYFQALKTIETIDPSLSNTIKIFFRSGKI